MNDFPKEALGGKIISVGSEKFKCSCGSETFTTQQAMEVRISSFGEVGGNLKFEPTREIVIECARCKKGVTVEDIKNSLKKGKEAG